MMKIATDQGSTATMGTGVARATAAIAFIDAAVAEWRELLDTLGGEPRVVRLDPGQDGVWQMSEVLATCRDLAAIHILAHGAPGCLRLGGTNLSLATLYCHAEQLASWRAALRPTAKILIYSGEVGVGAEGEALLRRLRELSGAALTVAAIPPVGPAVCGQRAKATRKRAADERPLRSSARTERISGKSSRSMRMPFGC